MSDIGAYEVSRAVEGYCLEREREASIGFLSLSRERDRTRKL
jgi:hypothetical protein